MVLLGALVVGLVAALGGDDDGDQERGPRPTTTTLAPIGKEGQELLARLERGRAQPLHLRFEPEGVDPTSPDGRLVVEIWRDGDRVRQDVVLEGEGFRQDLVAFELPDGTFACQGTGEEWVCHATRSVASEAGDPGGIVEAAAADLAGAEVTTTDETVAGREARCYAITRADGDGSTLCVTSDGIPVRMGVQGQQLTATVVEREVDGDVFTLPAEVTEPTVPSTVPADAG